MLAPARDLECGKAAIDHGADAVYIGAERFGARVAAGNSVSDIRELCAYAHRFAAKVYVTLNTIVYNDELDDTRTLIAGLDEAGVDAVLVQDMAVAEMLKGGRMAIHASTQTDNRTAEKVRWLYGEGFSRAVLARELSAGEIANIHEAVPQMELEVFVHGALCVSYSGLCYASQYCFGRSANRGACAQFCRLKFDLVDSDNNVIEHDKYLLSLKDMNQYDNIETLIEAGATSFKIEGRLKDIAYVKNVTAAYSKRLNDIVSRHPGKYCRASAGSVEYGFTPDLNRTFNRGYTSYFFNGRQPGIASMDTPKAKGEFVGTVKEIRGNAFTVAGLSAFANGDGLCFINSARQLEGFRVNKVHNNLLFPLKMPNGLRPGMRLFRNNDQQFEKLLNRPTAVRSIPVKLRIEPAEGGFALYAAVEGQGSVKAFVEAEHQEANSRQHDNIRRQLGKMGNTAYRCMEIEIDSNFNYFIPSSILSSLRRNVVELLDKAGAKASHEALPAPLPAAGVAGTKTAVPRYKDYSYLYNISNDMARRFYARRGLDNAGQAFEQRPMAGGLLMQCRHCLRYTLGYCVKNGGRKPVWHEPLFLVLPDNRRFRLHFDCANCQMNVFADENGR